MSFEALKTAFITAPILAYPIDEGNYVIGTDLVGFLSGMHFL